MSRDNASPTVPSPRTYDFSESESDPNTVDFEGAEASGIRIPGRRRKSASGPPSVAAGYSCISYTLFRVTYSFFSVQKFLSLFLPSAE